MNLSTTLIVASGNAHKVQEIQNILDATCCVWSMSQCGDTPALVEEADTFAGNAMSKATTLARWLETPSRIPSRPGDGTRWFVLADDSGLEVDALDGAPGVHSARFAFLDTNIAGGAATNAPDQANNAKLLRLLDGVPEARRTARFRCVLALVSLQRPHETPQLFQGTCEGRIGFAPAGAGGFGYDPLFYPEGFERSFAQLGAEIKNTLSHRARALAALKDWLNFEHPTSNAQR